MMRVLTLDSPEGAIFDLPGTGKIMTSGSENGPDG